MSKFSSFCTFILCTVFIFSCAETPKSPAPVLEAPKVGADLDAHGCRPSAGYTWSVIKGECIRVFESGIRLNAGAQGIDTTTSAFIVFKSEDEDAKVELFMPSDATSQMLDLDKSADDGAGTWKSAKYILKQWKGMYSLDDANGKTLFQGPAVR
jgi:hypothetical protein